MDTTKTITHLGLCAGYGGIELGLKRVFPTMRSVALCEIEAFAIANLVAKMEAGFMDPAPIWTDLKTFPWAEFREKVDVLSGGYPCQPFSAAGKRAGADDPRHLWPFISSGIQILRPRMCFFENVEGHVTLGLREVIADLESLGYQAAWGIFSAAEVGAPHQRKRVFILAHRSGERLQGFWRQCGHGKSGSKMQTSGSSCDVAVSSGIGSAAGLSRSLTGNEGQPRVADNGRAQDIWPSRPGQPQHWWEPPRVVGNASLLDGSRQARGQREAQIGRAGTAQHERQTQPAMGGDADGATSGMDYAKLCVSCDNRTDELRLLGNGVVPATAERAFRVLMEELL